VLGVGATPAANNGGAYGGRRRVLDCGAVLLLERHDVRVEGRDGHGNGHRLRRRRRLASGHGQVLDLLVAVAAAGSGAGTAAGAEVSLGAAHKVALQRGRRRRRLARTRPHQHCRRLRPVVRLGDVRRRLVALGLAAEAARVVHVLIARVQSKGEAAPLEWPTRRDAQLLHLVVESARRHAEFAGRLQSAHSVSHSVYCGHDVVSRVLFVSFPFRFLCWDVRRNS
jgi:hypothetical protein